MEDQYRLVAITRRPDGTIHVLGSGSVQYVLDKDSAWEDLNAILDDPDMPQPEPIQKVAVDMETPGPGIDLVEQMATEFYGPMVGKLVRNGAVGFTSLMNRRLKR